MDNTPINLSHDDSLNNEEQLARRAALAKMAQAAAAAGVGVAAILSSRRAIAGAGSTHDE